jgi:hypothetical protein
MPSRAIASGVNVIDVKCASVTGFATAAGAGDFAGASLPPHALTLAHTISTGHVERLIRDLPSAFANGHAGLSLKCAAAADRAIERDGGRE